MKSGDEPSEFPKDAEQARLDLQLTRKELGETTRALTRRLDAPARARESALRGAALVRARARTGAGELSVQMRERIGRFAEFARTNPRPTMAIALSAVAAGGMMVRRAQR